MPIREYQARDPSQGCAVCQRPFERLEALHQAPLRRCPHCAQPLQRLLSAPAVGASRSHFDARAKAGGFHKLKRIGRGEYERQY